MQIFQRKWLTQVVLLFVVLALAVSFTAVAQAGGGEEEPAPAMEAKSPPTGKPPMGKPVKPIPEMANCIGVTAFYDGNSNGMLDANENAVDGASIVLMQPADAPPEDPPIGPDGNEIVMEMPDMDGMPMMGPPSKMEAPSMMGPSPADKSPMGAPTGPSQRPDGPPMGAPSAPEKVMGPPMGPSMDTPEEALAKRPMPANFTPQYVVRDRKITRDGGAAEFCDLKPGTYVLQGDAPLGITIGPNRVYVKLVEDDFQQVRFGFTYLD
jgi:hypothetical protein